jgi:hypothetical protein
VPVRKEATEEEQALVAKDAQFEDDGIAWQIYSTHPVVRARERG